MNINLGQTVITSNAAGQVSAGDIAQALEKHSRGDWGFCGAEDWETNNAAARNKGMILSVWGMDGPNRFWIITDAGHEVTTVLMPEDY